MGLNANKMAHSGKSGSKQEAIEPGTYPIRVAQIIDLGLQPQRPYQGQEKPPAYEIMLTYEFLDEYCVDEDGNEDEDKPRWLSETLPFRSLKAEKAKSTQRYYALDPNEEFEGDFTELVGVAANASIVQNAGKGKNVGKVYNNVQALSPMRAKDASKAPELKNEGKVFTLDDPDITIFQSFPDWIQGKIKSNLEYKGSALESALANGSSEPELVAEEEDDGEW